MKKIIALIAAFLMMFSVPLTISADEIVGNTYVINGVTVEFDENSSFTAEEQKVIADRLVNGAGEVTTYNLICSLFGHNYETEYVTTITHKVNSSAPRCVKQKFEFNVCARCGDEQSTLINSLNIYCCS